jgi:peptide chain release factor subunit 1
LVVERPRVELWKVDGAIEKIGMFQGDLGKDNYGGFLGFDEKVVASRAEEETARVWREAGAAALSEHQARRADLVVVAGHHQHLDQFTSQLHPYLREAVIEHIVVDPHTVTPALLLDRVRGLEQRVRIRRDELAVQAVLEASYAGRPVARGLIDVLTAANLGAIDLLVVSGPFAKPGVRCDECGWLARSGVECPSCGAGTDAVDDVVGAAIESVLARGGRAPQVSVGSALDADGVAALLRFPLPAV